MIVPEVHNPSGVRVRYNMRKPDNNLACLDFFTDSLTGDRWLTYISGEGSVGQKYGITARNTVDSTKAVTISGTWGP